MEASRDGCHAPAVAGISGNEKRGMLVNCFIRGLWRRCGRDLKGTEAKPKNLRTAPQSSDQTLAGLNLALKVSCNTDNPVRVIRGFKGHSKWAPSEEYRYSTEHQKLMVRYDGL